MKEYVTPKRVKELIKFNELKDDPDINQMIDEFGLDKLSEALNKIASNRRETYIRRFIWIKNGDTGVMLISPFLGFLEDPNN